MTPTKAGILGTVIGATSSLAVAVGGFLVYDELTFTPTTNTGSCDHATYDLHLTTLGQDVLGKVVIREPDNLEIRDPNPDWEVKWQTFGAEVERITTKGAGTSSSLANLEDTDEGVARSVWIKRTDSTSWCKVGSSLG